jgi:hypothetical protein
LKDDLDVRTETSDISNPEPSTDIGKPTNRVEALRFFGLTESATDYVLEQKYWQMIKKYRVDIEANREKLDEINEVYEIASGKRQNTIREETTRDKAFKLFGKTLKEWRNHFYYSWWRYVLVVFLAVVVFLLVRHFFFTATIDLNVVAVGHFEKYNNRIEEVAKAQGWSVNPAVFSSNLVADNSEPPDDDSMSGEISATAFLSVRNDVIITDARTFPFFYMNFMPIDDLYDDMRSELTEEQLDGIEPIYYSTAEHYAILDEYGFEDPDRETAEEDSERHVYGLKITDPELIAAMGFENRWKSEPPSLIFCLSVSTEDPEKAARFLRTIIAERYVFMETETD